MNLKYIYLKEILTEKFYNFYILNLKYLSKRIPNQLLYVVMFRSEWIGTATRLPKKTMCIVYTLVLKHNHI